MTEPNAPAGWYDDPSSPGRQRYWDGVAWTEQLASVSPAAAPSPVGPATLPEKVRAPFYKKWWVWAIVALIIAIAAAGSGGSGTTADTGTAGSAAPAATPAVPAPAVPALAEPVAEPAPVPEPSAPAMTMGQENAVAKANDYLEMSGFSRKGLIKQLKYEGFSTADATFAVDHISVNWNKQAARKAQDYLDMMSFSHQGLIKQLVYEGFTQSQAKSGVKAVGY